MVRAFLAGRRRPPSGPRRSPAPAAISTRSELRRKGRFAGPPTWFASSRAACAAGTCPCSSRRRALASRYSCQHGSSPPAAAAGSRRCASAIGVDGLASSTKARSQSGAATARASRSAAVRDRPCRPAEASSTAEAHQATRSPLGTPCSVARDPLDQCRARVGELADGWRSASRSRWRASPSDSSLEPRARAKRAAARRLNRATASNSPRPASV